MVVLGSVAGKAAERHAACPLPQLGWQRAPRHTMCPASHHDPGLFVSPDAAVGSGSSSCPSLALPAAHRLSRRTRGGPCSCVLG